MIIYSFTVVNYYSPYTVMGHQAEIVLLSMTVI